MAEVLTSPKSRTLPNSSAKSSLERFSTREPEETFERFDPADGTIEGAGGDEEGILVPGWTDVIVIYDDGENVGPES